MTIGHQYFCSKWYTFAMAMTPLHGGATSGLKSTTPHLFSYPVWLIKIYLQTRLVDWGSTCHIISYHNGYRDM